MPAAVTLNAEQTLPADGSAGALAGRVWRPDAAAPVAAVRAGGVFDISTAFPTIKTSARPPDPAASLRRVGERRRQRHSAKAAR